MSKRKKLKISDFFKKKKRPYREKRNMKTERSLRRDLIEIYISNYQHALLCEEDYDRGKYEGKVDTAETVFLAVFGSSAVRKMWEIARSYGVEEDWHIIADEIEKALIRMEREDTSRLRCCPFCGNTHLSVRKIEGRDGWGDRYSILCRYDEGGCGAESGMYCTPEYAKGSWNDRVMDDYRPMMTDIWFNKQ